MERRHCRGVRDQYSAYMGSPGIEEGIRYHSLGSRCVSLERLRCGKSVHDLRILRKDHVPGGEGVQCLPAEVWSAGGAAGF